MSTTYQWCKRPWRHLLLTFHNNGKLIILSSFNKWFFYKLPKKKFQVSASQKFFKSKREEIFKGLFSVAVIFAGSKSLTLTPNAHITVLSMYSFKIQLQRLPMYFWWQIIRLFDLFVKHLIRLAQKFLVTLKMSEKNWWLLKSLTAVWVHFLFLFHVKLNKKWDFRENIKNETRCLKRYNRQLIGKKKSNRRKNFWLGIVDRI